MKDFDLIVIGSGPAGEKAAAKAAYFGYKVALVEKSKKFGGAGVQTGTLPSKTLKETAVYLSGIYQKGIFGIDKELGRKTGVNDFMYRKNVVIDEMGETVRRNLHRHKITVFEGTAHFIDEHRIQIEGLLEEVISGKFILIATGSYPVHAEEIPFDGVRVHDSDSILNIDRFPKSLAVLGAGVIGCEYATIFAAMGIPVYIINNSDKVLGFLDQEISSAFVDRIGQRCVKLLLNDSIDHYGVPKLPDEPLRLKLRSGATLCVDMFLFAAGRSGNISALKVDNAGIKTGHRETIVVNEKFQTNVPNIFAVGDVIGFPALASTSMDQGRVAVAHMFQTNDMKTLTSVFPYGIYTVPEISMVGMTEEQAMKENIPYGVGYCYYQNTVRGKIMGDPDNGFLKLVFDRKTKIILGVHILGAMATEIIHFGLMLVKEQTTLDEVIAIVFNYPTLHDLYKYASYDGLGNLAGKNLTRESKAVSASSGNGNGHVKV